MLFKLERGKDPFELNPELKALEAFSSLTPRQMSYVILVADYKTPFRKLSLEDKKYHAAIESGYKLEKDGKRLDMNARNLVAGKVGAVEAAIRYYRESLQKDEDYETLLSIGTLIAQIRELNAKPEKSIPELEKAVGLTIGKLDKLVETKKRLEEILDMREDHVAETQAAGTGEDTDGVIDEDNLPTLSRINEGLI
jgi:hypothetical protein